MSNKLPANEPHIQPVTIQGCILRKTDKYSIIDITSYGCGTGCYLLVSADGNVLSYESEWTNILNTFLEWTR